MVSTLQELCYQRLASTMLEAPPGLQEIIAGETRVHMENKIREEVRHKQWSDLGHIFSQAIPDIMEDLIQTIVTPGILRSDYLNMLPHLHPRVVRCAVQIAKEAVRRMEERYVYAAFRLNGDSDESGDEDYSEEEDLDSEGMYF
jgi:hypothetical protein